MMRNRRKVKLHIDGAKADEIRGKLLMLRINTLGTCAVSAVFLERVGDLKLENGRLEELFQCLVAVANHGRENILGYADTMLKDRQFEELTSMEADIIKIMLDPDIKSQKDIILTKDVVDQLNAELSERDKFKTKSIGWIIRRLGFSPRRSGSSHGWHYNKDLLDKLADRYLVNPEELGHPGKNGKNGENGALERQPEPEPFFHHCYFCQKTISNPVSKRLRKEIRG